MAGMKRDFGVRLWLALGLFILAGIFRQMDRGMGSLPFAICFLLTNFIYIGMAMAWGFSISRRILHRRERKWLLLGCAMMVLWLFLRAVKYRFFEEDAITRRLWYLYDVPQILAPLFSVFAALQLGRREDTPFSARWYFLFIPAALLIGGVLTNDLHHWAFRALPGVSTLEENYVHGWLYYLAMAWIVGLLLATGILVLCKCRVSESRKYAWIPACVFLGGLALCTLSFANVYTFHKVPECCCLTFAAFWESGLQVGLPSTNGHYRYFFRNQPWPRRSWTVRESRCIEQRARRFLLGSSFRRRCGARLCLTRTRGCRARRCRMGAWYWVEDVSRIHRIREQLAEVNAQLSEENELIRAENELKRQRAQIEEKNG